LHINYTEINENNDRIAFEFISHFHFVQFIAQSTFRTERYIQNVINM